MQRRLHQEIIHHDPNALVTVCEPELSVHDFHHSGLSSLQLAAQEGMWQLVVKLLSLGASIDQVNADAANPLNAYFACQSQKTPLYLAIEYGHTLLAQILLACGASQALAFETANTLNNLQMQYRLKQLELDMDIAFSLAFYATIKNDAAVVERILDLLDKDNGNISAVSALLEVALAFDAKSLALVLLQRVGERALRNDPAIYTAGYWASESCKDLLDKACRSDDDWLRTLRQLHVTDRSLKDCLSSAPANIKKEYLAKQKIEMRVDQERLTPEQNAAYAELARGRRLEVELYCETPEEFAVLAEAAWENKNLIILTHLLLHFNLGLFKTFIQNNQSHLAQLWFFLEDKHFHEIALDLKNESELLTRATNFFASESSLLHSLVGQSIHLEKLPDQSFVEFAHKVASDEDALVSALQVSVQDRYPLAAVNIELEESKEEKAGLANPFFRFLEVSPTETKSQFKINVSLSDALTPHDLSIVSVCFNRFGVGINNDEAQKPQEEIRDNPRRKKNKIAPFKDLPSHLWTGYIIPSLDSKNLKALASVSHYMHEYKLITEPALGVQWEANNNLFRARNRRDERLMRLENEAEAINRLLESMQNDLDEKPYGEERDLVFPLKISGGSFLVLALMVYGFINSVIEFNEDRGKLDTLMTADGKSCSAHHACSNYYYTECNDLCDSQGLNELVMALCIIGGVLSLAWTIGASCVLWETCVEGQDRFDHLPLSDLSENTALELNEAKDSMPDPLPHINANTRIGSARNIATALKVQHQREAVQIKHAMAEERRQEDAERKRAEDAERLLREEAAEWDRERMKRLGLPNHSQGKSARLVAGLGQFSPAKVVSGIASLFGKAQPVIHFEAAGTRLLSAENKYDNHDEMEDEGSYQPPVLSGARKSQSGHSSYVPSLFRPSSLVDLEAASAEERKESDQASLIGDAFYRPPASSSSKKGRSSSRRLSNAVGVELVISSSKKSRDRVTEVDNKDHLAIDIHSPRMSGRK
ncbi:MAG: ankyrin repeat domain-containing protein [Gammaproteobacteria bacterium]|nr:ankyrin repeat domain-containing protein [Gammaproteobacteria bacterium]